MNDEELDKLETFMQGYLNQLENHINTLDSFLKVIGFEDEEHFGSDQTRRFIEERLKILKDKKKEIDECQDRRSLKQQLRLKKMLKDAIERVNPYE